MNFAKLKGVSTSSLMLALRNSAMQANGQWPHGGRQRQQQTAGQVGPSVDSC
jgi:hypothetical protein